MNLLPDTRRVATSGSRASLSAAERAFRHVWGAVSRGTLAPGSLVTETSLAAEAAVSRTPLREAVQRLEALGQLVREPGRGLRVPPLSLREMLQLSATREVLEGLLAADAARRVAAGEVSVEPLRTVHDRLRRLLPLGDTDLSLSVSVEFHEVLRALSGNRTAAVCHEHVMLSFERYRQLVRGIGGRPHHIFKEHDEVISAIEAGDAPRAETAMREHIAQGRGMYLDLLNRKLP